MLLVAAGLLVLAALALFWLSARQRRQTGLPGGRVIYADPRTFGPVEKPFYDGPLGLTGKPDYLVQEGEHVIPVEVKTGRTPLEPRDGHIYQLAAYCLLVERSLGVRPPRGLLHYPARTFAIDYTPALENELLELLAEMRRDEPRESVERSHAEPARCARCGFRSHCDQRLA